MRHELPVNWHSVDCPNCGNGLKFAERIYSFRSAEGWIDGVLFISSDIVNSLEESDDEHLYCPGCLAEWQLPAAVAFV